VSKIPDINNLREERFISAYGFRGFGLSWWGGHGSAKQFTPWHSGSTERSFRKVPG
jgi:hypothetical protein